MKSLQFQWQSDEVMYTRGESRRLTQVCRYKALHVHFITSSLLSLCMSPGLHAKERATWSAIACEVHVHTCSRRFFHISRWRKHICCGCFLSWDVLKGTLQTVESIQIYKYDVLVQHWWRRAFLELGYLSHLIMKYMHTSFWTSI